MARIIGGAKFSNNFEPQATAPIDARQVITGGKAALTAEATWKSSDNNLWLYNGMLTTVFDDSTANNNGIYILKNKAGYATASNWLQLPTLTHVQSLINSSAGNYIPLSQKGAANGVATLDSAGLVPSSQLPSYVDDVIELVNFVTVSPTSGMTVGQKWYNSTSKKIITANSATTVVSSDPETGKIYVNLTDNKTYRWSGSAMIEISASLALGETSSTAYRGDRGKELYDWKQKVSGNSVTVSNETKLNNIPSAVVSNITTGVTASTVSLVLNHNNLNSGAFSTPSVALPVASSTQAGFISSTYFNKLDRAPSIQYVADSTPVRSISSSTQEINYSFPYKNTLDNTTGNRIITIPVANAATPGLLKKEHYSAINALYEEGLAVVGLISEGWLDSGYGVTVQYMDFASGNEIQESSIVLPYITIDNIGNATPGFIKPSMYSAFVEVLTNSKFGDGYGVISYINSNFDETSSSINYNRTLIDTDSDIENEVVTRTETIILPVVSGTNRGVVSPQMYTTWNSKSNFTGFVLGTSTSASTTWTAVKSITTSNSKVSFNGTYFNLSTGGTSQTSDLFITPNISSFQNLIRTTDLTNLSLANRAPITPYDSIITAFGKIQGQINFIEANSFNEIVIGSAVGSASSTKIEIPIDIINPNLTFNLDQFTISARMSNFTGAHIEFNTGYLSSFVRSTVLPGLVTSNSANITTTDTILVALGKLQAQSTKKIEQFYVGNSYDTSNDLENQQIINTSNNSIAFDQNSLRVTSYSSGSKKGAFVTLMGATAVLGGVKSGNGVTYTNGLITSIDCGTY